MVQFSSQKLFIFQNLSLLDWLQNQSIWIYLKLKKRYTFGRKQIEQPIQTTLYEIFQYCYFDLYASAISYDSVRNNVTNSRMTKQNRQVQWRTHSFAKKKCRQPPNRVYQSEVRRDKFWPNRRVPFQWYQMKLFVSRLFYSIISCSNNIYNQNHVVIVSVHWNDW